MADPIGAGQDDPVSDGPVSDGPVSDEPIEVGPGSEVRGFVAPGFEPVREAFVENFTRRGEVGAAVAVMHRGKVVVDLAGGIADPETGRQWTERTAGVCFSATKGLVAACFLMIEDRGLIDLDAPIAEWWPELGRGDKAAITPRLILNHRSGLSAVDAPLLLTDLRDHPDKVSDALTAQVPLWEPGSDQGYAACSYGLYTQELFRRVTGKTLGAFFAEEIAGPLGLQTVIGRPGDLEAPPARIVPIDGPTLLTRHIPTALFRHTPEGRLFRRILLGKRTEPGRAFLNPGLGERRFAVLDDPEIQAIEMPWMGAFTTARSLARVYAALGGDGSLDGVKLVNQSALDPLHGRQSWAERDRIIQKPLGWSQGFLKEGTDIFSTNPASFGHAGAGGAVGWVDPEQQLAIGYVMNRMDWRIRSPRALALCHAAEQVLR